MPSQLSKGIYAIGAGSVERGESRSGDAAKYVYHSASRGLQLVSQGSSSMAERNTGMIKWFNATRSWGIVKRANGRDLPFQVSDIDDDAGLEIEIGRSITFVKAGGRNNLRAERITFVD